MMGSTSVQTDITRSFVENLSSHEKSHMCPLKIVLPAKCRQEALVDLRHMNITWATLFPGLEGYARSVVQELLFHEVSLFGTTENPRISDVDPSVLLKPSPSSEPQLEKRPGETTPKIPERFGPRGFPPA